MGKARSLAVCPIIEKGSFAMSELPKVGAGRDVHDSVIESLAMQYQMDEAHIRRLYEQELSRLKHESRVKSFLPVLCSRHVKEILSTGG